MSARARAGARAAAACALACACCATACTLDVPLEGVPGDARGSDGASDAGLVVIARVRAEGAMVTSDPPAALSAQLSVSLTRAGVAVSDAVVTVASAGGVVALVAAATPGTYTATQPGYASEYTLDVQSGSVHLTQRGAGPPLHTLAAPQPAVHVRFAEPLEVTWRPFDAPSATIDTLQFPLTAIADTGTYQIPASALSTPAGTQSADRVRLCRGAHSAIAGAAPGADLLVEVCTTTAFVIDG